MRTKSLSKRQWVIGTGALAICTCWFLGTFCRNSAIAQPPPGDPWKDAKYFGAGMCKNCHTKPAGNDTSFVLLNEFTTWRAEDRHSLAYAALKGRRGQKMGQLLGMDVTKAEAGCLGCHSMHFPNREGPGFSPLDGISCDGCHGPSQRWIADHTLKDEWRKKSPEEKERYGMRDLRDPAKRAALCSSCHVGNAAEGKIVTHAMYAAGHPPLPGIELAAFSNHLPQHWRDLKDVPYLKQAPPEIKKLYHYDQAEFQKAILTVVGSGAALAEQMDLVAGRAKFTAKNPREIWPELALPSSAGEKKPEALWPQVAMAHFDCYVCHHELIRPSWRQERGYGVRLLDGQVIFGVPGRPQIRPWPLQVLQTSLLFTAQTPADANRMFTELHAKLDKIYAATNGRPFGIPEELRQSTQDFATWSLLVTKGTLANAKFDAGSPLKLLRRLGSLSPREFLDFDEARQIAWALQAVYEEWSSPASPKLSSDREIRALLSQVQQELDLWPSTGPDAYRERRKALIVGQLTGKKLSPAEFQDALANLGIDKVRDAVLAKEFLEALDKLSEEQYKASSEAAASYDAVLFKNRLAQLSKLLTQ
jgi:hypothetical protein